MPYQDRIREYAAQRPSNFSKVLARQTDAEIERDRRVHFKNNENAKNWDTTSAAKSLFHAKLWADFTAYCQQHWGCEPLSLSYINQPARSWAEDVSDRAGQFFVCLLEKKQGRDTANGRVRSVTAMGYRGGLAKVIVDEVRKTDLPTDHLREIMSGRHAIYERLYQKFSHDIGSLEIERSARRKRARWGKAELALLIDQLDIDMSASYDQTENRIQLQTLLMLIYYTGARPGAFLQSSYPWSMQSEDIVITRDLDGIYHASGEIKYLKGLQNWDKHLVPLEWDVPGPSQAVNVRLFDLPSRIIALAVYRRNLLDPTTGRPFQTLDDFFASPCARFPLAKAGAFFQSVGKKVTGTTTTPWHLSNAALSLQEVAAKCGFSRESTRLYSFRRGTASTWAELYGQESARTLLCHGRAKDIAPAFYVESPLTAKNVTHLLVEDPSAPKADTNVAFRALNSAAVRAQMAKTKLAAAVAAPDAASPHLPKIEVKKEDLDHACRVEDERCKFLWRDMQKWLDRAWDAGVLPGPKDRNDTAYEFVQFSKRGLAGKSQEHRDLFERAETARNEYARRRTVIKARLRKEAIKRRDAAVVASMAEATREDYEHANVHVQGLLPGPSGESSESAATTTPAAAAPTTTVTAPAPVADVEELGQLAEIYGRELCSFGGRQKEAAQLQRELHELGQSEATIARLVKVHQSRPTQTSAEDAAVLSAQDSEGDEDIDALSDDEFEEITAANALPIDVAEEVPQETLDAQGVEEGVSAADQQQAMAKRLYALLNRIHRIDALVDWMVRYWCPFCHPHELGGHQRVGSFTAPATARKHLSQKHTNIRERLLNCDEVYELPMPAAPASMAASPEVFAMTLEHLAENSALKLLGGIDTGFAECMEAASETCQPGEDLFSVLKALAP
ncbi:unnamed protein product [Parajaminaea phylloscopi]